MASFGDVYDAIVRINAENDAAAARRMALVKRHNQIAEALGIPRDCQTTLDEPMTDAQREDSIGDSRERCGECGLPLYRHLVLE